MIPRIPAHRKYRKAGTFVPNLSSIMVLVKNESRDGGHSSKVVHLSDIHKALALISSTSKEGRRLRAG